MSKFKNLFPDKKPVIAMIHTDAMPGTFRYQNSTKKIINKAISEAEIYKANGIHTVMIENMHDVPYINKKIGHEVSSLMAIIAYEIKSKFQLTCGIQILAGANKQALAVANSAGIDFIRAEGYVFSHIADEGIMNSDAGDLKRYQKKIGAENVLIFTDIKKKHASHRITSDISITETASTAEFFDSDGIIITGSSTGKPADFEEVIAVKKNVNLPVIIGSGLDADNISKYYKYADGFIVGSYFKENNIWSGAVSSERVNKLMSVYKQLI